MNLLNFATTGLYPASEGELFLLTLAFLIVWAVLMEWQNGHRRGYF